MWCAVCGVLLEPSELERLTLRVDLSSPTAMCCVPWAVCSVWCTVCGAQCGLCNVF